MVRWPWLLGHVILREDLQDTDFIDTWCNVSTAELKKHYKQFTPEWASALSGVPVETIERIAREFATTKPATTYTYRGPAKHLYGSYNEKATHDAVHHDRQRREARRLLSAARHGLAATAAGAAQADECHPYMAHPHEYPLAEHKVSHLVPYLIAEGKQKINVYFSYQDNRGLHQSRVRRRTGASCTATRS